MSHQDFRVGREEHFVAGIKQMLQISRLASLRHLSFPTKLTDVAALAMLTRLTHLELEGARLNTAALTALTTAIPSLQVRTA